MTGNVLGYCVFLCFLMITTPFWIFSEEIIALRNRLTSKWKKIFWTLFPIVTLLVAAWLAVFQTSMLVNRIYVEKTGIIKEIIWEEKDPHIYGIIIEEQSTGEENTFQNVYSKNLKEGDEVQVRKFYSPVYAIKKNAKNSNSYKADYEKWLGNPIRDKFLLSFIAVLNVAVHKSRFRKKRKLFSSETKGKIYWQIWNWGCIAFTTMMFVCIWYPAHSYWEGCILGGILVFLYVVYQAAGFAYQLENPQFLQAESTGEEFSTPSPIEKDAEVPKEKQLKSVVRLVPLTALTQEQAKCYCRNKYRGWRSTAVNDCLTTLWCCSVCAVLAIITGEIKFEEMIIPAAVILFILIVSLINRSFNKKCEKIRKASESLCEYAIIPMVGGKDIKFKSTSGEIIQWKMEYDEELTLQEGQKAVVFYLSATRQMFTEKSKVLKDIL